jgi:hypothetical protein
MISLLYSQNYSLKNKYNTLLYYNLFKKTAFIQVIIPKITRTNTINARIYINIKHVNPNR